MWQFLKKFYFKKIEPFSFKRFIKNTSGEIRRILIAFILFNYKWRLKKNAKEPKIASGLITIYGATLGDVIYVVIPEIGKYLYALKRLLSFFIRVLKAYIYFYKRKLVKVFYVKGLKDVHKLYGELKTEKIEHLEHLGNYDNVKYKYYSESSIARWLYLAFKRPIEKGDEVILFVLLEWIYTPILIYKFFLKIGVPLCIYLIYFLLQFVKYLLLKSTFLILITIIPLLMGTAFLTLAERKIMSAVQRRRGPTVIGFHGLLQPFIDAIKMLNKEAITPGRAQSFIYILMPIAMIAISLAMWLVIPLTPRGPILKIDYGLLYILILSGLNTYGVLLAGWSSNSKYAFIGGLRAAAQKIGYEIVFSLCLLFVAFLTKTLNLTEIIYAQKNIWLVWPLLPVAIIFYITLLIETNRTPYDLPEAEGELVAGYNLEYSSILFGLFFVAEYMNIIVVNTLFVILFLGGWLTNLTYLTGMQFFAIKIVFFCLVFIWIRATLPRYRIDQLIKLCWTVFLPILLTYFMVLISIKYTIDVQQGLFLIEQVAPFIILK